MKVTLKDISKLQSGVYVPTSNYNKEDAVHLVGLKDFDDNLQYLNTSSKADPKVVKEKYIIGENHVLFSSRLKFNAFSLPQNTNGVYVASNSFIIIKPDLNKVLPAYLSWYINHPNTQQQLSYLSLGASRLPYINQSKLENLEVELPKLTIQKDVVNLYGLLLREKQLTTKLLALKQLYVQTALFNKLK